MGKVVVVGTCPPWRYIQNVVCCLVLFGRVCEWERGLLPGDKNKLNSKVIKFLQTSLGSCGALSGCPGQRKPLLSAGWLL